MSHPDPPTVKVLADYECWPLWTQPPDEPDNLDPFRLVSSELADALMLWAGRYDDTLDQEDPRNSGFADDESRRRFVEEGRALAQRVASELSGRFRVVYFDNVSLAVEEVPA